MNENKTQSNIFFFSVFMESDIENSPAGHFPCENTTINTPEPTGVSTVSSSQPVTHSDTATQLAEETTIFTSKISTSTDFTIESELSTSEKYDTSIKTTIGPTADISPTNGDAEVSTEDYTTVIPTSSFEKTTLQPAIGNRESLTTNINEDTPISSIYMYTTTTAERTVSTTLDSTVSQTTTSTSSAETTTHSVTFVNSVADLQESITSATTTTNAITSAVETRASATDSITSRYSTNSPQTASLLFTSRTCAPCVCNNYTVTDKTSEQILKEILEIKKNLTVKKSTLSSYTRQKISAPDGRWSSAALGSVGVVIIVSASILVILSDIQYVSKAIKVWKKRLEQYRYYLRYNDFDKPYIYDISYVYDSFRFTFRFF